MLQEKGRSRPLYLIALLLLAMPARGADWLPVSRDELEIKREPKAPTASAIFLYRQVDRDDTAPDEYVYARIKVLTEEGRKHANVEIPYARGSESIGFLQARTIRSDGTIVDFDGTVYDKELVKARSYRVMAKSFTLPNVEVGSIIEYRYRRQLPHGWVFNSRWVLSDDLFTRRAVFSLKPSRHYTLKWGWPRGLPPDTEAPKRERDTIRLETRDVPAFVTEEYMPPEDLMKYRVEFIYEDEDSDQADFARYWKAFGKRAHKRVAAFASPRPALQQAAAEIVQPDDSAETKVRKIYARVQQIRNLSFERNKTEQEAKRENLTEILNAEDVWRRGYGNGLEITWLYLALVRAAGLEAHAVLVAPRDDYFFSPQHMNSRQLNSNAVFVKLGDRELFVDPGTPFAPFGLLPWSHTGVVGLRLDKDGGTWVRTPLPPPADSRVERKAALKLTRGSLEGKVTVTYTGLEALWRRLRERNEDDTHRQQFLERDLKADVPAGIDVKLTNMPDWGGIETPLVAEFDLRVPGWAAAAGKRALLPVGLFGGGEKHVFEHGARVHPVYFRFPYQHTDEVAIELSPGWQVSSLPKARNADINVAKYSMTSQAAGGALNLRRELTSDLALLKAEFYGALRDFYQSIRAGDEDQAVLSAKH
ncbi:MAG: DUF3857 domain-containing protein [Gammaproteobacteria bacterium]